MLLEHICLPTTNDDPYAFCHFLSNFFKMIPQIDRSRLHAFYRVCLIQTCQTILSCIFAHISRTRIRYKSASTPPPSPLKVHVRENFSKFIFIYSLFPIHFTFYGQHCFTSAAAPHKSLCRKMLDLNLGLLRLLALQVTRANLSVRSHPHENWLPVIPVKNYNLSLHLTSFIASLQVA